MARRFEWNSSKIAPEIDARQQTPNPLWRMSAASKVNRWSCKKKKKALSSIQPPFTAPLMLIVSTLSCKSTREAQEAGAFCVQLIHTCGGVRFHRKWSRGIKDRHIRCCFITLLGLWKKCQKYNMKIFQRVLSKQAPPPLPFLQKKPQNNTQMISSLVAIFQRDMRGGGELKRLISPDDCLYPAQRLCLSLPFCCL